MIELRRGTGLAVSVALGFALMLAGPVLAQASRPAVGAPAASSGPAVDEVDLVALGRIAVQRDGRVKTFESFGREMMGFVLGSRRYREQPPLYTYLDLMFRPEAYTEAEIIFVKSKLIRAEIVQALRASMEEQFDLIRTDPAAPTGFDERQGEVQAELDQRFERFEETGLIAEPMLVDPKVRALLDRLETDLLRSAKFVRMIDSAVAVKNARLLRGRLLVVPPPGGGFDDQWLSLDDLGVHERHGGSAAMPPAPGGAAIVGAWSDLETSWRAGDAAGVNAATAVLVAGLPAVNPDLYPQGSRLALEGLYFRLKNMTWVWVFYALALIPLILNVVFRWRGARWLGMGMFTFAFLLHTAAVMIRWYVAQRWPNSNMFEAITTAAWFGGCFALLLEIVLRRMPVRSLFAIGSAAASMVALMAVHFLPLELSANVGNMMPVLHDVWLYIHTNVIIFSYCLIFMASVPAVIYLLYRGGRRLTTGESGVNEFARVGGAASLIEQGPDGTTYLARARTTIGQVLDGTTMILLEMSFILLWTGLVMGAIWADHSWGRPWGWDPKEVFALNTFIVFALLIHTRLQVRDKGLWTAVLALVGCVVMLFNWIVINFTISGLHSYA